MSESSPTTVQASPKLFVAGSLVLGFGLGGLADGIVLHQVLQWHNLTSGQVSNDTFDGLQTNVFWDGVFHMGTTVVLLVGLFLLWRAWQRPDHLTGNGSALIGLLLVGWGTFHVVDQLVFHELLGLHAIREGVADVALYNWGFFAIGLLLAAAGGAMWTTKGQLGPSSPR